MCVVFTIHIIFYIRFDMPSVAKMLNVTPKSKCEYVRYYYDELPVLYSIIYE
jgi:hypothetical protein